MDANVPRLQENEMKEREMENAMNYRSVDATDFVGTEARFQVGDFGILVAK